MRRMSRYAATLSRKLTRSIHSPAGKSNSSPAENTLTPVKKSWYEGEELTKEQSVKLGAVAVGGTLCFGSLLWCIWEKEKKIDSINQEMKELDAVINFCSLLEAKLHERKTNLKTNLNPLETNIKRENLIPSSPGP